METNTRRVEVAPGVEADIPVEVFSRALTEAELTVKRRVLAEALSAVGDAAADEWLEAWWRQFTGYARPAARIREMSEHLLAEWDREEDRMRARLRLPPRQES